MRLIDAENLNFNNQKYNRSQLNAILDFIDNQPTVSDAETITNKQVNASKKFDQAAFDRETTNPNNGHSDRERNSYGNNN